MTRSARIILKIVQWTVRLVLLGVALGLSIGGPVPTVLAKAFPGLSPLVELTSPIARRGWYLGLYWLGPPLVVLLLGLWKGRLFCRWICPAGTVYAAGSKLSFKKRILKTRLNVYLFWLIVGASLTGAPLLLFLDPLSTFNRITPLLTGTYTIASLVPGLIVPLFLLLGFIQPLFWCAWLCPLGYFFELCQSARRRPKETFIRNRRQILIGLLIGLPAGILARRFLYAKAAYGRAPVLPPGAGDMERFAASCTRCYACVNVCPYKLIRASAELDRAVGQLLQPELHYVDSESGVECGYCPEWCNVCTEVCAAGALTPLSLKQKRRQQIGTAKVIREACLAWQEEEDCSVCQEVCPYQAIDLEYLADGRARPIVNADVCRGCGACYSSCPAVRAGKAIIVTGVRQQMQIAPEDDSADLAERSPRVGPFRENA